jgi:transforming growth factor-beta-induced protein
MDYITRLTFVLAAVFLPSSSTAAQNVTNLAEILAEDPNLSTLNTAIMTAGMNISDIPGDSITVFAPTNDAFANIDAKILQNLQSPGWTAHLENVLWMHIVDMVLPSSALTDGEEVFANNTETIFVSIANGNVSLTSPNTNNSIVTEANVVVVEGVLHQVDSVLLPAFVSNDLLSLAGNNTGFSILSELLEFSGLTAIIGSNITATVFAPTDDAFKLLGAEALAFFRSNVAATTALLMGHVITPQIIPTHDMVAGPLNFTTSAGTTLNVTIEETGDGTIYIIDDAAIDIPNFLANNGIVHALGAVLAVPGAEYPTAAPTAAPKVKTPTSHAVTHNAVTAAALSFAFLGWFITLSM